MRIIDKNNDYYDYLQDVYKDDTFTFDRRNSYILKKCEFAKYFRLPKYVVKWIKNGINKKSNYNKNYYVLMQIGNSFWVLLINVLEYDENYVAKSYDINLVSSFKDFDAKRELINLEIVNFNFALRDQVEKNGYNTKVLDTIKKLIKTHDYHVVKNITSIDVLENGGLVKKNIPILKEIGIPEIINPMDIYFAFEEYFSLEKTSLERVESVGLTDEDKLVNHGFDIKTSFRNNKK